VYALEAIGGGWYDTLTRLQPAGRRLTARRGVGTISTAAEIAPPLTGTRDELDR
jgi:hypothetical protein